jgi:hypothetical protein
VSARDAGLEHDQARMRGGHATDARRAPAEGVATQCAERRIGQRRGRNVSRQPATVAH